MVVSILRYMGMLSPILDDKPRVVSAYMKCDFLLSQAELEEVLSHMKNESARAYAAMGASGFKWHRQHIKMRLSDYDETTGTVKEKYKLPPWAAKYVTEHKLNAIGLGLTDDDPLFFRKKQDGTYAPIAYSTFLKSTRRAKASTGFDIVNHMWVAFQLYFVPKGGLVKYK